MPKPRSNIKRRETDLEETPPEVEYSNQGEFKANLDSIQSANTPNNSSGNSSLLNVYDPLEGEGATLSEPRKDLVDEKTDIELTPDDPAYREGLTAIFDGVASQLPDCPHRQEMLRLMRASAKLPSGEVSRLADMAERKAQKWDGVVKVAPAWYQHRPASQKLPEFLMKHYQVSGHFNGKMDSSHIEILDPHCGTAIRSWLRNHKGLPEGINLKMSQSRPGRKR